MHNDQTEDFTDETPTTAVPVPFEPLTIREREVAGMLCRGMKNSEIAEAMGISIKTVDTHRGHVLTKLEVRNNVELLTLAIRKGWVRVEVSS